MINPLGLSIAIAAHILNGSVSIIDKFLLTKTFRQPAAYAFWIGLLGLGALVLLAFGFAWPTPVQWLIDLSAGATFVLALYFLYVAIQSEEISRVAPIVGSLTPVFTIFFARLFLAESLNFNQIIAIIILILGIILLTFRRSQVPINFKLLSAAPLAALLFAASSVLMKEAFSEQSFFAGLAWSRLGGLPIILLFLAWAKNRQAIFEKEERPKGARLLLFLGGRIFSAAGFLLVNLAIALISPTIVNALQGVQYAFIFCASLIFTKIWPQIIKEQFSRSMIVVKIIGILAIIVGSIALSIY